MRLETLANQTDGFVCDTTNDGKVVAFFEDSADGCEGVGLEVPQTLGAVTTCGKDAGTGLIGEFLATLV